MTQEHFIPLINKFCHCVYALFPAVLKNALITQLEKLCSQPIRASDISRGRGPAKFRHFRKITQNSKKKVKYREIRQKYFQIHVGKTYLILFLQILTFLPRKSRQIGRFFREFALENPVKFCFFFREISEALTNIIIVIANTFSQHRAQ